MSKLSLNPEASSFSCLTPTATSCQPVSPPVVASTNDANDHMNETVSDNHVIVDNIRAFLDRDSRLQDAINHFEQRAALLSAVRVDDDQLQALIDQHEEQQVELGRKIVEFQRVHELESRHFWRWLRADLHAFRSSVDFAAPSFGTDDYFRCEALYEAIEDGRATIEDLRQFHRQTACDETGRPPKPVLQDDFSDRSATKSAESIPPRFDSRRTSPRSALQDLVADASLEGVDSGSGLGCYGAIGT